MNCFICILFFVMLGFFSGTQPNLTDAKRPREPKPKSESKTSAPRKAMTTSTIHWYEWNDQTFDQAKQQDKLILLDLTAVWCHWCHVMDRTSYADPAVIDLINSTYLPVRVDADQRPDIQDRYLMGGWPTTAILTPEGEVVTGGTYLPPEQLKEILTKAHQFYHTNRTQLQKRLADYRRQQEDFLDARQKESKDPQQQDVALVLQRLQDSFDSTNGGFGPAPKFPNPAAISLLFYRYHKTAEPRLLLMALVTLEKMLGLYDPVWGGFYRYSVDAQWKTPHYEKMLSANAGLLGNYLQAYQVTGEAKYLEVARGVVKYLNNFMSDPQGGFYGSQDADLNSHDQSKEFVEGEKYYPKSARERLALGIPHIDRTFYINWNGEALRSFCAFAGVTGDAVTLDFVVKTIERFWTNCFDPRRGFCHFWGEDKGLYGLLSDQVNFGLALITTFQITSHAKYIARAKQLADLILNALYDQQSGGFFYQPSDPNAIGRLALRDKPFDENVQAVRFFTELFQITQQHQYQEVAQKTLRFLKNELPQRSYFAAGYALAVEHYFDYPVYFFIVARPDDKHRQPLITAAQKIYEPRKVVMLLEPEQDQLKFGDVTFPKTREARLFLCVERRCSPPLKASADLVSKVKDFLRDQ